MLLILTILCLFLTACGQKSDDMLAISGVTVTTPENAEKQPEPAEEVPSGPLAEGDTYRDFTATLADGSSFTLSDHEGKVILLNFWATWCGPCVGEMPAFPMLAEKYGEDLVLLAVNCGESAETVTKFLNDRGFTFPVAIDTGYKISELYPSDGIPYTVIFGPDGTAAHIKVGARDAATMFAHYSAEIDALLAE